MVPSLSVPTCHARALGLVDRLAGMLVERNIKCCHWKGTFSLESVVAGEKDIDLLVDSSDEPQLMRILADLGFKEAVAPAGQRSSDMAHYFGYDHVEGHIVDLHVHYRIVLGDAVRGTYRLSCERAYLATAGGQFPFPIPQVEFEFVLFVLRMMLGQTGMSWRWRATCLTPRRAKEFEYLRANSSRSEVDAILRDHLPFLDPSFFHECSDALAADDRQQSRALSRELRRRLDNSQVCRSGNLLRSFWRRGRRAVQDRLLRRPRRKRRMAHGGVTIALVGGDGAGKSTVIEHVRAWLAEHFDVEVVHLGKPRRSMSSWVIRGSLRLGRALRSRLSRKPGPDARPSSPPTLSQILWHFCVARDRYHTHRKARRRVAAGRIVVFDRWPLPDVVSIDGPQIRRSGGETPTMLTGLLGKLEERWLRSIGQPDLLVVLKLDPEIAVQRKPEERPDFVRARGLEIWNADWSKTEAHVIHADAPLTSVLSQVKALVWKAI